MTDKEIVSILGNVRKELSFHKPSFQLIRHIAEDSVLLSLSCWGFAGEAPLGYLFSQLGFLIFFFRSFGIMHEAVHNNLSNSPKLNTFLGIIYGAFCFLPFLNWKKIHLQHHLWAGNLDRDPTMKLVKAIPNFPDSKLKSLNLVWKLWIPYLALLQHIVFWKESVRLVQEKPRSYSLLLSLLPPLAVMLGVLTLSLSGSFVLGVLPAIVAYLVLVEVVNFPHHLGMPYREGSERLSFLEQYKVSRSCHYSVWVGRFVFMNFNYHVEHHLYPNLPWHQLRKASVKVKAQLGDERYIHAEGHSWILESRHHDLPVVLARQEPSIPEAA